MHVDRTVSELTDQVRSERSLTDRAVLVRTLREATDNYVQRLLDETAYLLRESGVTALQTGQALGVEYHTAGDWAERHALRYGLPPIRRERFYGPLDSTLPG